MSFSRQIEMKTTEFSGVLANFKKPHAQNADYFPPHIHIKHFILQEKFLSYLIGFSKRMSYINGNFLEFKSRKVKYFVWFLKE